MDTDTFNYDPQEPEVSEPVGTSTGTSKVLGMFFGMVVVCAVFFAFGFTLGRNAVTAEVKAAAPESASPTPMTASAEKPSPVGASEPEAAPPQELTFQKSLESQQPEPALTRERVEPAPRPTTTAIRSSVPAGYVVQIAALTQPNDADALVSVLRRKKYPVFLVNTSPTDRFYR
ncbi:MAG: SPOR domain-containing protein, partial [Nevskiales bacterium]